MNSKAPNRCVRMACCVMDLASPVSGWVLLVNMFTILSFLFRPFMLKRSCMLLSFNLILCSCLVFSFFGIFFTPLFIDCYCGCFVCLTYCLCISLAFRFFLKGFMSRSFRLPCHCWLLKHYLDNVIIIVHIGLVIPRKGKPF